MKRFATVTERVSRFLGELITNRQKVMTDGSTGESQQNVMDNSTFTGEAQQTW